MDKHINDITKLTSEKASLSDERNALSQRIEEIEDISKTYLNTVKGAFESERAKLEDEIKKRSSKLKSVDAQRQGTSLIQALFPTLTLIQTLSHIIIRPTATTPSRSAEGNP